MSDIRPIEAPKGTPVYGLREFSLAPWQKQKLEDALQPYLGKKPDEIDRQALAIAVSSALPKELLPQIKESLTRNVDAPVVIHNLPEVEWSGSFADRAKTSKKDALTHSMSFWITQGIFELAGCTPTKSALFLRKGLDDGFEPPYEIHRDMNPVSAMACLHNPIHAPTQFIDMIAAIKSLPVDIKDRLKIKPIPSLGIITPISLAELEPKLHDLRYNNKDIPHGIVLEEPQSVASEDLNAYEQAIAHHTIEVDLQPGTLVVWDTAYHRARGGKSETIDPTGYTRAAMFVGAGRPI